MINIAIVGCTGKLGSKIMKNILKRTDVALSYAIARKGNSLVGQDVSTIIGGMEKNIVIIDDICEAVNCDVFIDCTNAETFINDSLSKYRKF